MRKFGLIGYPLSHSFSKKFFSEKFRKEQIEECIYELFPIANIELFEQLLLDEPELEGINVTIPYKLQVLPLLHEVDEAASEIGAVNCIKVVRIGTQPKLKGFNTDAYGFEASLIPLLEPHHTKAIILGDGGAAKAVKYVLKKLNIPYLVLSRKAEGTNLSYQQMTYELLQEYTIVINTTPLGMSPDTEACPDIPYGAMNATHLAYDLIYNPEETTFLRNAAASGAVAKNGMEMLYLQAERSWDIWNS